MRHYLAVKALFTSLRFFKMAADECCFDVLYTFAEIKQMEKTALVQVQRHKQALMLT